MLLDSEITAIRRKLTGVEPGSYVIDTQTGEVRHTDSRKAFLENMAKSPVTPSAAPDFSL